MVEYLPLGGLPLYQISSLFDYLLLPQVRTSHSIATLRSSKCRPKSQAVSSANRKQE